MIDTEKMAVYKAFGLTISSDIPLPELQGQQCRDDEIADVHIREADLTGLWRQISGQQKKIVVKDNIVMFQLPDVGTFCIRDGETIEVSPAEGSDPAKMRLYILGTCIGVILLQRKILPLHGSAISVNGKAYAVVGDSGAGKSTLASVLLNRGYRLLSDDVIAVTLTQDNIPMVMPSYPRQKLWQDSIDRLGMELADYQPLFERENKFAVPVHSRFYSEPLPLAGIFELVKTQDEQIGVSRIQGLERISVLQRHTYRRSVVPSLGLTEWHFNTSVSLLHRASLFRLRRPVAGFTAHDLADSMISEIRCDTYEAKTALVR
ncbi:phosphoenolpyruvate carboxykinase (ATP) [Paenibacillus alkalitolerans]|uniref:aldolase n=1 Tax=Paenibacillus alkalitolerans TaxID=2799335 RepID=UPI0018F5FC4E|nr:aldolase [Paenibacillus alkalitolerans]